MDLQLHEDGATSGGDLQLVRAADGRRKPGREHRGGHHALSGSDPEEPWFLLGGLN